MNNYSSLSSSTPVVVEKPQAAHPYRSQYDGAHGWVGPTGGRKRSKASRQAQKAARKRSRK